MKHPQALKKIDPAILMRNYNINGAA